MAVEADVLIVPYGIETFIVSQEVPFYSLY